VGRFSVRHPEDARRLAEAVASVSQRQPVDVVHAGEPEPELERAFGRAGVRQAFRSLGLVPYAGCLGWLKSCNCAVANALSDVSVPAKIHDYIGANLPLLVFAPRQSAVGVLVARFPGAFVVQDSRGAASALVRMMSGETTELESGLDPTEFSLQYQFAGLVERMRDLAGHGAESEEEPQCES
jgi:hypothetical protein